MQQAAIGVFDSGVGGLSVLREIRAFLPQEDLLYVADSGAAPYGDRSERFIMERVQSIVTFLLAQGVKAIVIACNTATAVAVKALRSQLALPVIAIEPAVKPAAKLTRSGRVGVLATQRTLTSSSFSRLVDEYRKDAQFILQPCPGLVEQVEQGELDGPKTRRLVTRYVELLIRQGADILVLGCTHYPFLMPVIQEVAGPGVTVLDPSDAVARQVVRRLKEANLLADPDRTGTETFWTSGDPEHAALVISRLWGKAVSVEAMPEASTVPDGGGQARAQEG